MAKLTARQADVLDFIRKYISENGCPPTRAEIANGMGFRSTNSAEDHLRALERKKVINLRHGTSRGISIVANGIPVVGNIVNPQRPLLSQEHISEYLEVKPDMFGKKADYFVKVQDSSMSSLGIFHGDLLAAVADGQAENGDIVVARTKHGISVRRFHQEKDTINLISAIKDEPPLTLHCSQVTIEGIGVGVLRPHLNL